MNRTILRRSVFVALMTSALAAPAAEEKTVPKSVTAAGEWSQPVNNLSARLLLRLDERKQERGASTYRYIAFIEFRNVGAEVLAVSSRVSFADVFVNDAEGKPVAESGYIQDGTVPLAQWAHVPGYDAYLGVRVDMATVYALSSPRQNALLAIDDHVYSLAPGKYSLRATLIARKVNKGPDNQWLGEIELKPVSFTFSRHP